MIPSLCVCVVCWKRDTDWDYNSDRLSLCILIIVTWKCGGNVIYTNIYTNLNQRSAAMVVASAHLHPVWQCGNGVTHTHTHTDWRRCQHAIFETKWIPLLPSSVLCMYYYRFHSARWHYCYCFTLIWHSNTTTFDDSNFIFILFFFLATKATERTLIVGSTRSTHFNAVAKTFQRFQRCDRLEQPIDEADASTYRSTHRKW